MNNEAASAPPLAHTYAARLRQRFGERLSDVRLFGSYARGEASEDSDIDIFVLVADLTHREKIDAIELSVDVALGTGVALSPLVMSPSELDRLRALEARLARDIDLEGVPL